MLYNRDPHDHGMTARERELDDAEYAAANEPADDVQGIGPLAMVVACAVAWVIVGVVWLAWRALA